MQRPSGGGHAAPGDPLTRRGTSPRSPEPAMDLLLLAVLAVSVLVGCVAAVWALPALVAAAIAAAADDPA